MRPDSGRIHNFRHNGNPTLRLGEASVHAKVCATNGGATAPSLHIGAK